MRNGVIRWSGVLCLVALAACGAKEDGAGGAGTGGAPPSNGGGAGGSTPPGGGTNGGGTGGNVSVPGAGSGGTTPTAGTSGGGTGGNAGGAGGTTPAAGTGGSAGSPGTGDGPFAIPATCGMPTQNATVGNACPGTPPPAIKLTTIVDGLVGPTYVIQAPGDPSRFYVTEQLGPIRVIKDGMLQAAPLVDISAISSAMLNTTEIYSGYCENGLLNMVFDPQFETNKKFYVSFTKIGPEFVIAELTMKDDFTVDPATYKELKTFPQYAFGVLGGPQASNHVGSMMQFGPDGCMYVSRGEGGGENDVRMTGQNTMDTESSILRIDIANVGTPPAGNLSGYVWNYGFRNPWRFSFDRVTGDMYIGDVGQDSGTGFEEVNVEPRGVMGNNYGWWPAAGDADCDGCRKPAVFYGITPDANSVIGGYVYRGSAIPGMVGRYIWADWTEREIKTFVYKGENAGQPEICDEATTGVVVPTKVRSFGQGLDGEIYLVAGGPPAQSFGSAGFDEAGTLYRIDPM